MSAFQGDPIQTTRDVIAILVPEGNRVHIPEGTECRITQALGGSYTIYVEGRLFRVNGEDADVLGKTPPPPIELPEGANDEAYEDLVWDQLRTCFDPEIPINIVELGLVYGCSVESTAEGRNVYVEMTLTAPGCGMGDILVHDVTSRVECIPTTKDVKVELVFDPPWNQTMMSEAARLQTGMY